MHIYIYRFGVYSGIQKRGIKRLENEIPRWLRDWPSLQYAFGPEILTGKRGMLPNRINDAGSGIFLPR